MLFYIQLRFSLLITSISGLFAFSTYSRKMTSCTGLICETRFNLLYLIGIVNCVFETWPGCANRGARSSHLKCMNIFEKDKPTCDRKYMEKTLLSGCVEISEPIFKGTLLHHIRVIQKLKKANYYAVLVEIF